MSRRTTHSDLARVLRDHAAALAKLPVGLTCADASSRDAIVSAAAALDLQDSRIDEQTVALAAARSAMRRLLEVVPGAPDLRAALELVNDSLRWTSYGQCTNRLPVGGGLTTK